MRLLPWGTWRYDWQKAMAFIRDTGFRPWFRGFVWPLTRNGGIVVGWMWREPAGPSEWVKQHVPESEWHRFDGSLSRAASQEDGTLPISAGEPSDSVPHFPNAVLNDLLAWIDNEENELADDAILKFTTATGHAITHVTAGWVKRFITATNGSRFGDCPGCGRRHGAHTPDEQAECDRLACFTAEPVNHVVLEEAHRSLSLDAARAGQLIDGEEPGYIRRCADCGAEDGKPSSPDQHPSSKEDNMNSDLSYIYLLIETNDGGVDWTAIAKKIQEAIDSEPHIRLAKIEDSVKPSRFIQVGNDDQTILK